MNTTDSHPGGQARFDLDDLKAQLHAWRLADEKAED